MNETEKERFERRKGQKTYSHFQKLGRIPSEYEVVSSKLTYNTEGFALQTPVTEWYDKYRDASPLTCSDWERFSDPRQTIYRRYCEIQFRQETYLDFVLERIEADGFDQTLSEQWLKVLQLILGPCRFPVHGMQMIAAYFSHLAPSSRITNCAAFQAGDEMRLIQRLAYRVTQLKKSRGGFGEGDRATWEDHPVWQPLRACIERMLITWDWAEAFVALNVVLKPMFESLYFIELAELAVANGDTRLSDFLYSFTQDAAWHRDWTRTLVRTALDDNPANHAVVQGWVDKWFPVARAAIEGFAPVFDSMAPKSRGFKQHLANVESRYSIFLTELGFTTFDGALKKSA